MSLSRGTTTEPPPPLLFFPSSSFPSSADDNDRPCLSNSSLALAALPAWNSKVNTRPVGATARASECVSDPEPVPVSSTTEPGASSSRVQTRAMSAA